MDYERLGKKVMDILRSQECACLYRHLEGLKVSTQFLGDPWTHRYRLEARTVSNEPNGKTLCAIMQNPSYADDDIADKSVNFLEHLVFDGIVPAFAGVNRLIIVNLFALVQTRDFVGNADHLEIENDLHIKRSIEESDIVLIAWGARKPFGDRKRAVEVLIRNSRGKRCFRTKKHPSLGVLSENFVEPCPL